MRIAAAPKYIMALLDNRWARRVWSGIKRKWRVFNHSFQRWWTLLSCLGSTFLFVVKIGYLFSSVICVFLHLLGGSYEYWDGSGSFDVWLGTFEGWISYFSALFFPFILVLSSWLLCFRCLPFLSCLFKLTMVSCFFKYPVGWCFIGFLHPFLILCRCMFPLFFALSILFFSSLGISPTSVKQIFTSFFFWQNLQRPSRTPSKRHIQRNRLHLYSALPLNYVCYDLSQEENIEWCGKVTRNRSKWSPSVQNLTL